MTILESITDIFRRVLKRSDINLTLATTNKDVKGWDSLNHIRLLIEIEKEFKVKFATTEIMQVRSVQDIIKSVESKIPLKKV